MYAFTPIPAVTAHEDDRQFSGAWLAHWEHLFEVAMSGLDTSNITGRQWFNRYRKAQTLVHTEIRKDVEQGLRLAEAVLLQTVGGQSCETEVTGAWFDLKRQAGRLVTMEQLTPAECEGVVASVLADLIDERRQKYNSAKDDEAKLLGTHEVASCNTQVWLALQGRAA